MRFRVSSRFSFIATHRTRPRSSRKSKVSQDSKHVRHILSLKTKKAEEREKVAQSLLFSLSLSLSCLVVLLSRGRVQLTAAGIDQVLHRARHSLLSLSIRRTSLPVDEMRVSQLEALRKLELRSCRYTPGHFSTLSSLQQLQRLILSQPINEAEAIAIGNLTCLELLHVRPYLAPSPALAHSSHLSHLSNLTRLVSIDLANSFANDDALSRLHKLSNLTSL